MSHAYTTDQLLALAKLIRGSSRTLVVLALADVHPESGNLSWLGERLLRTSSNVTQLIDGLEAGGWVNRVRHPTDRRQIKARLTEKCLAAIARVTNGGASQP